MKNKIIDTSKLLIRVLLINSIIAVVVSFINVYYNSSAIRGFTYGIDFVVVTTAISGIIAFNHNDKIYTKRLNEIINKLEKSDNNEQVGNTK